MEEAKGVVKHLLLAKFKDDVTAEKIEELIKGYANLVNLVPPMKSFHWYAFFFLFRFLPHTSNSTTHFDLHKQHYLAHPMQTGVAKSKLVETKDRIFNNFLKKKRLPSIADENWIGLGSNLFMPTFWSSGDCSIQKCH